MKPRTVRAPVREPIREEPVRQDPARKVRTRKSGTDRLHIPQEMIPEGIDLQWVTDSVLGQPASQVRMSYEVNGWEPVTPQMFQSRFDGMFMKRGHQGEINVDGLVLMWRPLELTIEAINEERQSAMMARNSEVAKINGGKVDGVTLDMSHPSARRSTFIQSEIAPGIAVPD